MKALWRLLLLSVLVSVGSTPAMADWAPLTRGETIYRYNESRDYRFGKVYLPNEPGIYRYSEQRNYILSVLCSTQPALALSLAKGGVLGALLEDVTIDGEPVLDGTGVNIGLQFDAYLKPNPHFRLKHLPSGFINLLREGRLLEARILDRNIRVDLRGFDAVYTSTCGRPDPTRSPAADNGAGILSTPVSSGWRVRLDYDCNRGRFVFTPTDPTAKWGMGASKVDGSRLPSADSAKAIFDGDMVGAIRLPYQQNWFDALRNGNTLTVEITDYSSVGGPKESEVHFDLQNFCR